jgi:hypothetical protein
LIAIHPWWYGDINSNNMKTRQSSSNAHITVAWLEKNNFRLHNTPGIATHFPRGNGEKPKSPTVLDLCFSRGAISKSISSWLVDHESTSDHSIVGLLLSHPAIDIPSTNSCLIRFWSKADRKAFNQLFIEL